MYFYIFIILIIFLPTRGEVLPLGGVAVRVIRYTDIWAVNPTPYERSADGKGQGEIRVRSLILAID